MNSFFGKLTKGVADAIYLQCEPLQYYHLLMTEEQEAKAALYVETETDVRLLGIETPSQHRYVPRVQVESIWLGFQQIV